MNWFCIGLFPQSSLKKIVSQSSSKRQKCEDLAETVDHLTAGKLLENGDGNAEGDSLGKPGEHCTTATGMNKPFHTDTNETSEGCLRLETAEKNGCIQEAQSVPRVEFQMDNSIFIDEDSNQPMPVGQFFGNIELVQVRLRELVQVYLDLLLNRFTLPYLTW